MHQQCFFVLKIKLKLERLADSGDELCNVSSNAACEQIYVAYV
jgi:hypothetical protein